MRPSIEEWALAIAEVVATRATCRRRAVGCVLLDARGKVLATGYNGRASGLPHCVDQNRHCTGASHASGTDLDGCEAIHAEANALLQCSEVREIATTVVTVSPCVACTKLLLNTGCRRIVFKEKYAHDQESKRLWRGGRRKWIEL